MATTTGRMLSLKEAGFSARLPGTRGTTGRTRGSASQAKCSAVAGMLNKNSACFHLLDGQARRWSHCFAFSPSVLGFWRQSSDKASTEGRRRRRAIDQIFDNLSVQLLSYLFVADRMAHLMVLQTYSAVFVDSAVWRFQSSVVSLLLYSWSPMQRL